MYLIEILLNWAILFVICGADSSAVLPSALIMAAFVGAGFTPIGEYFFRLAAGGRPMTKDEKARIAPVVESVLGKLNLNWVPEFWASDHPYPNGLATGRRTIVLTRPLVNDASPDELAGVIAHEIGHIRNGDTRWKVAAYMANAVGLVSAWLLTAAVAVAGFFASLAGFEALEGTSRGSGLSFMFIVGFFAMLAVWFLRALISFLKWLSRLGMLAADRGNEFRADRFAAESGYGAGLVSFLSRTAQPAHEGFWSNVYATHPPAAQRIEKIKQIVEGR
ncbi:MAG: M48 family metalloprotease [Peptococcaceae bacterium]|nr:M48 family metalloprotease [Peptococcaceae bacterium]